MRAEKLTDAEIQKQMTNVNCWKLENGKLRSTKRTFQSRVYTTTRNKLPGSSGAEPLG